MTPATRTIAAAMLTVGLAFGLGQSPAAHACSRVLHVSADASHVVTGRSMDWFEDIKSNLWAFPRGLKRDGAAGANSLAWVSKYGSVITAGFDVGSTDGLNEQGLAVNMLYLGETDFGARDKARPGISWSAYTQYLLDSFATVAEAVEGMNADRVQVVGSPLPGSTSKPPSIHFALSDATGDSAIFEYLDGKLVIHHGKQYIVMTNSPVYSEQLALNAYWETVGGDAMLPGTRRAADRYVRASFYAKQLPDPATDRQAIANVLSVVRNVSVPFGATDPNAPNLSTTIWRTVADHTRKVYFFESTLSPNVVWVRLDKLNFAPGVPVKKLTLVDNYDLAGEVSGAFEPARPFAFTGAE
jgi:choloylglycine hydrolase